MRNCGCVRLIVFAAALGCAITQARAAGLDVRHALVLVDRQEDGGCERVEALGVPLTSLLTLQDLKDLKGQPDA